MPIDNGRFEEAGVSAGVPRGWRWQARVRSTEIAVFDLSRGFDGFEWLALRRALGTDVVRAVFGTAIADDFASWAPGASLVFDDVAASVADFDSTRVERFAPGWDSGVALRSWAALVAAAAQFGIAPVDDFTSDWPGTAPRYLEWSAVVDHAALFGAERFERFDSSWPAP